MLEQMINEMFSAMGMDGSTCFNCSEPLEGEGFDTLDSTGNIKICAKCNEALERLKNKVDEGLTVTYRDGTTERIGGRNV